MTKLSKEYEKIMEGYRAGAYGTSLLTLSEILSRGGDSDILKKMNLSELQSLEKNTSGMMRQVFSYYAEKKAHAKKMKTR